MRKLYIALAAMALSLTAAKAQHFVKQPTKSVPVERTQGREAIAPKADAKKAPKKALASNQRYVGLDLDDEVPGSKYGLGLPSMASYVTGVGSSLSSDLLETYNGCKVVGMRYGLCNVATVTRLFVTPINAQGYLQDDLVSVSVTGTPVAGWNEVKFDTPFTIDTSTMPSLLIGFDYTQTATSSISSYPLASSGTGEAGGFLIYFNSKYPASQGGEGWYSMGTDYGNLCIQLLVEKDGEFDPYDIAIKDIYGFPFTKEGVAAQQTVYLTCKNGGTTDITSAEYGVAIDGTEVASLTSTNKVGGSSAYVPLAFIVPSTLSVGSHTLTAYAKKVAGADPTGNLRNDTIATSFKVYSQSFARDKQLVEHFTSQYCTYCPYGYDVLNALCDNRDDIAWVSIHGDMSSGTDVYTVSGSEYITNFSITGFPSANFNRFYLFGEETVGQVISYTNAANGANYFGQVIDLSNEYYPAFATVGLKTAYDADTRKLSIDVSGDLTSEWKQMLGEDATLTVYLTEDSLVSRQLNNGKWIASYPHNHVLRKIVSGTLGDKLKVADDNTYAATYSVDLDSEWKPANMNVVAFVSRPVTYSSSQRAFTTSIDDAWVTNTASKKFYELPTGIASLKANEGSAVETVRYNLSGSRLSAPSKGLNLVKMSDGTVRKQLVK